MSSFQARPFGEDFKLAMQLRNWAGGGGVPGRGGSSCRRAENGEGVAGNRENSGVVRLLWSVLDGRGGGMAAGVGDRLSRTESGSGFGGSKRRLEVAWVVEGGVGWAGADGSGTGGRGGPEAEEVVGSRPLMFNEDQPGRERHALETGPGENKHAPRSSLHLAFRRLCLGMSGWRVAATD